MTAKRRLSALSCYLQKRRITTRALARVTGYSTAAVTAWRVGARRPSIGARCKLAGALGIPEKALVRLLKD